MKKIKEIILYSISLLVSILIYSQTSFIYVIIYWVGCWALLLAANINNNQTNDKSESHIITNEDQYILYLKSVK